jgi:site-specific DNA recombinase
MYAEDRLGCEAIETGWIVKQIIDANLRLFFADGTERKLGSATDALLMNISNFGAAFERERAVARTRDKMFSKAASGQHTGGCCYGYDSVAVNGHVELRVNPIEAAVVRRIFEMSVAGLGIKKIATTLNDEGVRGPKNQWSATGVRDLLRNERYCGTLLFGRTRWEVRGGVRRKIDVPKSEWKGTERQDLRIVPDALWTAVRGRIDSTFKTYLRQQGGRLTGKPERGLMASSYLLSGMLVCGLCGGSLTGRTTRSTSDQEHRYYVCGTHRTRGRTACTNNLSLNADAIHNMIVTAFQNDVLTVERVERTVRGALEDQSEHPAQVEARRQALTQALEKVESELERLTNAIAGGADLKSVLEALKNRERERDDLRTKIEHTEGLAKAAAAWDSGAHGEALRAALADWHGLLDAEPVVARQILRKLLLGPIHVLPEQDDEGRWTFSFVAPATYDRAIYGIIGVTAGTESFRVTRRRMGSVPVDDFDAELRRLLTDHASMVSGTSVVPYQACREGGSNPHELALKGF